MRIKSFCAVLATIATLCLPGDALGLVPALQIHTGTPLAEVLSELHPAARLISHELSSASPLLRTDVFRLTDGRLVAMTSRAEKLGQPYVIKTLRITPTPTAKLTTRLPIVTSVTIPGSESF